MPKSHIRPVIKPRKLEAKACQSCQVSCQSACKTSCTVGNQPCLKGEE